MIRANKGGPLAWAWGRYVTSKVRGAFRGVWAQGTLPPQAGGLILYPNHVGFWDGFVLDQLARFAGWDAHCFMDEANLRRYRFLSRIGAFSVRPGDAASARESMAYARDLLRARKTVIIFPQGELRPQATAPGPLSRGVELLARQSGARCLPLGLRYAFFEAERPDVLVHAGEPHGAAPLARFEAGLTEALRRVHEVKSLDGLTPVTRGRAGVAERWDAVRGLPKPHAA